MGSRSRSGRRGQKVASQQASLRRGHRLDQIQLHHQQISWQGPLPPPGAMAAFEQIERGLAGRIVGLAENSLEHQREEMRLRYRNEMVGNVGGYVVIVTVLAACLGLVWLGQSLIGATAFIGAVGIMAFRILHARRSKELDSSDDDQVDTSDQPTDAKPLPDKSDAED